MRISTPALLLLAIGSLAHAEEIPKVLDPDFELTLFAKEPDIVTPTGATFDKAGRLLVLESHTHFRPKDYEGPPADRIRIVEDTDKDGKADRFTTYYEGLTHGMALALSPEGFVYVATRAKVLKLVDADADGIADRDGAIEIARLDTPGVYPHNGLCGLAFDAKGRLWFGLGENLGKPYKLIGSDGTTLEGGGEGGNIYVCNADGSGLRRVATGFWNPFGICHDPMGRVFTVDNDPDATPYCRLLHIVPGADFGYQFRYGRSGKHPLQAWQAELPGTLPIVCDTGEAPCAIIPFEGRLWVTSCWNFRLERYELKQDGASWKAQRENVVQGDQWFRPVDFAQAPDGSLFITDWAHAEYKLHGRGRIWRLARKEGTKPEPGWRFPDLTDEEKASARMQKEASAVDLKTEDRFAWQAAVTGLANGSGSLKWTDDEDPRVRHGVVAAARQRDPGNHKGMLPMALKDSHDSVRLTAIRWASDEGLKEYRKTIEEIQREAEKGSRLAKAAKAAADRLK